MEQFSYFNKGLIGSVEEIYSKITLMGDKI